MTMDRTESKDIISIIMRKHVREYGKIFQKLLALTFQRLGYELREERAVQGVDIDVRKKTEQGEELLSLEVKSTKRLEITIEKKDIEGLSSRSEDGYRTFYALLYLPVWITRGWIIAPAQGIKAGKYIAESFLRKNDDELSEKVNLAFLEILDEVAPWLINCEPGSALRFLKQRYGI